MKLAMISLWSPIIPSRLQEEEEGEENILTRNTYRVRNGRLEHTYTR